MILILQFSSRKSFNPTVLPACVLILLFSKIWPSVRQNSCKSPWLWAPHMCAHACTCSLIPLLCDSPCVHACTPECFHHSALLSPVYGALLSLRSLSPSLCATASANPLIPPSLHVCLCAFLSWHFWGFVYASLFHCFLFLCIALCLLVLISFSFPPFLYLFEPDPNENNLTKNGKI